MDYVAKESDVKDSVNDFITFCDFIEAEQPFATAKGDLSVKACYEVNKLLRHPEKTPKTTDRMYQYTSVSLWFAVAQEAGFIALTAAKGGKNICQTTDKYADFKNMGVFSQYSLIFYVWYCFVDPEVQYNERGATSILGYLIDEAFAQIVENGSQKWVKYSEKESHIFGGRRKPLQAMMYHYYKTAHNFRDLGLIVFEIGGRVTRYFNLPLIERLKPTEFGVSIAKACAQREYAKFNNYVERGYYMSMYDENDEEIEKDTGENGEIISFIDPFIHCFPENSIDTAAISASIFEYSDTDDDDRVFEFKVSLGKKCYRVIRCLPEHTFEDLHLAIQEAFDFENDHLYSFYLDGKSFSNYAINAPYCEEPPFTDEVCLKDERLVNGRRILYLFDYGDCWEFDVTVDIKHEAGVNLKSPEIIKSVGKAPEQYPDFDEGF